MISQVLRDARQYEEVYEKRISREERPDFHLCARVGWMNDPNGFSFYKGEYHLFYQYYPYAAHWDSMHWAHAVSKDLLHWRHLPAALAPDTAYDKDGCYSGSAAELSDGRQLLMYTGVVREVQEDGRYKEVQAQCVAVGDGIDYEKYGKNPVISEKDLPEGGSRYDFRDPKIWKNPDGTFSCVVANRAADKSGSILMYESPDGFSWKFQRVLKYNHNRYGRMWECPDFFELDGVQVLLLSPQDMLPKELEYHNGNGTICLMGYLDKDTGAFVERQDQAIDYGIDFYAPQTILTPDGRRVMIGWMQNWDTCNLHSEERSWIGQMSIPRELTIEDGRLIQKPIRELEKLRCHKVEYKDLVLEGTKQLQGIAGRRIDLELTVRPADADNLYQKFVLYFAQDEIYHTSVSYRPYESVLKIDRKFSGSRRAVIHQRRSLVKKQNGEINLRLILDRYSVEVFVNGGEQVVSATIYTDQSADRISFYCDGAAVISVTKYDLIAED